MGVTALNLPDVIRHMQDQIIKVEGTLNDLREAYECAKTYTQLVKQDVKNLPRR